MDKRGQSHRPAKHVHDGSSEDRLAKRETVGLCSDCAHCRQVQGKGAELFYLCGLSSSDPAYPKYPRLPVRQCAGYRTNE